MEHVIRSMRIDDGNTWLGICDCIITWQQTHSLRWSDYLRLGFVIWPNRLWSFTSSFHSVFRSLLPKRTILRFWVRGRTRHHLGLAHRHNSFGSVQATFKKNWLDRFSPDKRNVRHCLKRWSGHRLGRKHVWVHSQISDYEHHQLDETDSIFAQWKVHIEHVLAPNRRTGYADR